MMPAERAIWAAAYGAAFAAEVRELEQASDEPIYMMRTIAAGHAVSIERCLRVADDALARLKEQAPMHAALATDDDEPAPHSAGPV